MFARGGVLRYFEKWKEATLKPSREQCAFLQVLHTGSSRHHGGICADLGRLELLKHLGALVYIYKYEYSYISIYIYLCIYIYLWIKHDAIFLITKMIPDDTDVSAPIPRFLDGDLHLQDF